MRFLIFALLFVCFQLQADPVKPHATVMIPMRDGVSLPTDLYLPETEAKHLPCILLRGPAGRHAQTATLFAPLAQEGYLVAIQDTRSALDAEGKTIPFLSDGW